LLLKCEQLIANLDKRPRCPISFRTVTSTPRKVTEQRKRVTTFVCQEQRYTAQHEMRWNRTKRQARRTVLWTTFAPGTSRRRSDELPLKLTPQISNYWKIC